MLNFHMKLLFRSMGPKDWNANKMCQVISINLKWLADESIAKIKKQGDRLRKAFNQGLVTENKSLWSGKYPELDSRMIAYIDEMTSKGVNNDFLTMEVKAKQIMKELGSENTVNGIKICIIRYYWYESFTRLPDKIEQKE